METDGNTPADTKAVEARTAANYARVAANEAATNSLRGTLYSASARSGDKDAAANKTDAENALQALNNMDHSL